jgi:hypothetical protein
MGVPAQWTNSINLDLLGLPRANLQELDERFPEEEVWIVIPALPPDKAPGPDGFTACFL